MRVSGSMLNIVIRDLLITGGLVLLLLALLPGCGGKYEMPTETFNQVLAELGDEHVVWMSYVSYPDGQVRGQALIAPEVWEKLKAMETAP